MVSTYLLNSWLLAPQGKLSSPVHWRQESTTSVCLVQLLFNCVDIRWEAHLLTTHVHFLEETCTLAIVMLSYFDPKELGLPSGAVFSPRDVSSFNDVGYSAVTVANDCLSRVLQRNRTGGMTGSLGFRSATGWASQGKSSMVVINNDLVKTVHWMRLGLTNSIGAFLWATGSDIDRRVRPGISRGGVVQHYNMTTENDADSS